MGGGELQRLGPAAPTTGVSNCHLGTRDSTIVGVLSLCTACLYDGKAAADAEVQRGGIPGVPGVSCGNRAEPPPDKCGTRADPNKDMPGGAATTVVATGVAWTRGTRTCWHGDALQLPRMGVGRFIILTMSRVCAAAVALF